MCEEPDCCAVNGEPAERVEAYGNRHGMPASEAILKSVLGVLSTSETDA